MSDAITALLTPLLAVAQLLLLPAHGQLAELLSLAQRVARSGLRLHGLWRREVSSFPCRPARPAAWDDLILRRRLLSIERETYERIIDIERSMPMFYQRTVWFQRWTTFWIAYAVTLALVAATLWARGLYHAQYWVAIAVPEIGGVLAGSVLFYVFVNHQVIERQRALKIRLGPQLKALERRFLRSYLWRMET